MNKKKKNYGTIKLIISIVIICLFIWFLIISPKMTFNSNENKMREAAKRYFELNSSELPTGKRVKTITLTELYSKKYLDSDFYAPYSNNLCNQTDSWVKVRKQDNGSYEYLVYLNCGVLQSNIDHKGPEIKLNGDSKITIEEGNKYTEKGIKSVTDNNDGKLSVKDVEIKGTVDTSKVGTYTIQYIAFDSLKNKTVVKRVVTVVKSIRNVVKKDLGNSKNYVGNPENNYVRFSNMMFRVYGLDSDNNVILVAAEDVANVNFTKIDKWLNEYYYNHLTAKAKKMIVKAKYCNMNVTDSILDTTECSSYTKKINVYVPSIVEVNKAQADMNFMKPYTISWVANAGAKNTAYVTRDRFYYEDEGKSFIPVSNIDNYGVRPMITIKGNLNVISGDGKINNPYLFDDSSKVKGGENVSALSTGEYVSISNTLYRVIDSDDGAVKVIADDSIVNELEPVVVSSSVTNGNITYNPQSKKSVAYFINNRIGDYVDSKYFENHTIIVPIYKKEFIYGEETSTKTYRAKIFAPNMYEMFSAQTNLYGHLSHSYWLLNSSNARMRAAVLTDIGVPLNEKYPPYMNFGIRICAYLKESAVVTSGSGTHDDPYLLK